MTLSPISRKSQFAHFLHHKIGELKHRLLQIQEITSESQKRFDSGLEPKDGEGRELNYRFSAFSALIQTLKDILPILTDAPISWSELSEIRHMDFMRQARNAMTHDGNPIINLWADGRYYIGCDFVRMTQTKTELVKAPTEDIQTVCIEFTQDMTFEILRMVKPLIGCSEFTSPLYGFEFFNQAILHPAVPEFAGMIYTDSVAKPSEHSKLDPLCDACNALETLLSYCQSQRGKT